MQSIKHYLKKVLTYIRGNKRELIVCIFILFTVYTFVAVVFYINFKDLHPGDASATLGAIEKQKEFHYEKSIEATIDEESSFGLKAATSEFKGDYPNFASLNGKKLVMNPKRDDLGEHKFEVVTNVGEKTYIYSFSIVVKLADIGFDELEQKIRDIIGEEEIDNYAVYVYDFLREEGFDINGDEVFRPGSTSKLPYGIIVLRDVDAGKYTLESVKPYLERMLQLSDNEAMMYLDNLLGGFRVHNQRVRDELGIDNYFRYPHTCTAKDIGKTYYGIYHQKFLSKELNDYLIDTLVNSAPGFDNRLKQGIPEDVDVAHKTGYVWTDYGIAYNDTAIVFGEKTDFILVVLDKDTTQAEAIAKMKPIAETVYETLDVGPNPTVLGISTFSY